MNFFDPDMAENPEETDLTPGSQVDPPEDPGVDIVNSKDQWQKSKKMKLMIFKLKVIIRILKKKKKALRETKIWRNGSSNLQIQKMKILCPLIKTRQAKMILKFLWVSLLNRF